jgi:magnesium-transporting ATPase (P-type)
MQMMSHLLKPNPWAKNFAYFLIWVYVVGGVIFYFVGPIYATMTRDNSWFTVEWRLVTAAVNAVAALLIMINRRIAGLMILALVGTVVLLHHTQKNDYLLLNLLASYWDVWILLLLEGLYFLKRKRFGSSV